MAFHVESFVFGGDGDVHQSLKLPAKQYTLPQTVSKDDGLTVLFAHGIGLHKEHWEPIIESILRDKGLHVCEAWSLEFQSHGDGAVINEESLESREEGVSVMEWALAIADFIRLKRLDPHRTVAVAYSAGGCAMLLSTKHFPVDNPPFAALVLIEPTMMPKPVFEQNMRERTISSRRVMRIISSRREAWASKEDAFSWMIKRPPWHKWDPRVLKLYVEHGLQEINIDGTPSVKIKCAKKQESRVYCDWELLFAAMEQCVKMHKILPIHIIFGDENEIIPEYIQQTILDPLQGGCVPASVQAVLGSGHMIPQEKPDDLAQAIRNALIGGKSASISSKL